MNPKSMAAGLLCWAAAGVAFAQAKPPAEEKPADVGRIWESTAAPAEKMAAPPKLAPGAQAPAVFDRGMLVDLKGFTLYTFDGDRRANVSTCHGVCETLWPPHFAPEGATATGEFTVVHRRGGALQWAWRGKPLYRWARDRKPGDVTGDNVNNVWHLVRDEA
jgi:predicted lipoprotein with Yx(FWY)xxD motif